MKYAEIFRRIKVLEVTDDFFIGARGYKLYQYTFAIKKYECIARIQDAKYALFSKFSLTRRFFRAEINGLYQLSNGDRLAIAKKGIFKLVKNKRVFHKCCAIKRGSRPLNLCITPDDKIYFGEYFANTEKQAVNVYCSDDSGETWHIAYSFKEGEINHIHGLFYDEYTNRIWIVTGDRENECIIANTDDNFKTLNIVFRGGQEYRCCQLFFYRDYVVLATDSQYMHNEIKSFNRQTLTISYLASIQGTAIKGGQYGDISYLSTTVEPSEVNLDKKSHLWISCDGQSWQELYAAQKDCLPAIFQFGSIEFPKHYTNKHIMFSGRALQNIDGKSIRVVL